jgi:hypothetical protein
MVSIRKAFQEVFTKTVFYLELPFAGQQLLLEGGILFL